VTAETRLVAGVASRATPFMEVRGQLLGYGSRSAGLVAATDASLKGNVVGLGYIVTDGRYGVIRRPGSWRMSTATRVSVDVLELRAIAALLFRPGPAPGVLFCDNGAAVLHMKAWQDGYVRRMPSGYVIGHSRKIATLRKLAARVRDLGVNLEVRQVPAHTGHLLNEAADSLAKIGRSGGSRAEVQARAEWLADGFLASYHLNGGGR